MQACPKIVTDEYLQIGQKIANGMRIFWDDAISKVKFSQAEGGALKFATPKSFGNYFSISWNFGFDFIEATQLNEFVTVAIDEVNFKSSVHGSEHIMVYLNIEKGRKKIRLEAVMEKFDGRMTASFDISEHFDLWKSASVSWVDIIFTGENLKGVSILNPCFVNQKMAF